MANIDLSDIDYDDLNAELKKRDKERGEKRTRRTPGNSHRREDSDSYDPDDIDKRTDSSGNEVWIVRGAAAERLLAQYGKDDDGDGESDETHSEETNPDDGDDGDAKDKKDDERPRARASRYWGDSDDE